MRVINVLQLICPTGFYGAERWILALARNFSPAEVNCELATTLERDSANLQLVKMYREEIGEAFEIPMTHRFDLKVLEKLERLVRERSIDVIHTHGYKSDILGLLTARKVGIPCLVTPHGFENAADLKLRFFTWLGCKAMARADAVAPLSPQLMSDCRRVGVAKEKLYYVQNGVDLHEIELLRKRSSYRTPTSEKRIGYIGQLITRKNLTHVLDVFEMLNRDYADTRLLIVGDGDHRPELEAHAEKLGSRDRVEFLGFRQDRLEILKSLDLFVMTSTLEGIPRCLMEACAMGVPVAAYNIPGIDQLITHDETGLLAPLGDRDTLKTCWERLLYRPEDARRLAENARRLVQTNYSAERMANEYLQMYRGLLAGKIDHRGRKPQAI